MRLECRSRLFGLLLALFAGAWSPALLIADVPAEPIVEPQPAAAAPLEILVQESAKPMWLEIPKSLLPEQGDDEKAGVFGRDGVRTIVAGVSLSLAAVIGGLWLVRRARVPGAALPKGAIVVAVVGLFVGGLVAASAWADIPVPGGKTNRPRPPIAPGLTLKVVIVEEGEKLVLHASKADLAKLAAAGKAPVSEKVGAPRSAPKE